MQIRSTKPRHSVAPPTRPVTGKATRPAAKGETTAPADAWLTQAKAQATGKVKSPLDQLKAIEKDIVETERLIGIEKHIVARIKINVSDQKRAHQSKFFLHLGIPLPLKYGHLAEEIVKAPLENMKQIFHGKPSFKEVMKQAVCKGMTDPIAQLVTEEVSQAKIGIMEMGFGSLKERFMAGLMATLGSGAVVEGAAASAETLGRLGTATHMAPIDDFTKNSLADAERILAQRVSHLHNLEKKKKQLEAAAKSVKPSDSIQAQHAIRGARGA